MTENHLPDISLAVGGKDFSRYVLGVTVVHELGRIPFLRASLEQDDGAPALKPGDEVEFQAGYDGKLKPYFKGVLVSVGLFISGGARYLRLEARDKFHLLTLGRKTRLFLEKSDDEICSAIISESGLSGDIPSTAPAHKQFQQISISDWDFILSRLRANSLIPNVKAGQLTALELDELGSASPVEIDVSAQPVLEVEIAGDSRAWFNSVSVLAWDEAGQKVKNKEAKSAAPTFPGNLKGTGEATQEILVPHALEDAEMEAMGKGLLWRLRQGFICGRICLAGLFAAEPGQLVEIKKCLAGIDGQAVVRASRLEIKAGECRHDFQFGYDFLEEFSRGGSDGSGPWTGERTAAIGLYPAKVLKLSEDPDKGERLKIHIPLMHKEGEGVWARLLSPYAGDGHAIVFRPEKDDEVLAGFLGGDPAAPVVIGGLFSKAGPAPDKLKAADEKNSVKGLITKSGISILLNEDNKSVAIQTPGEQSLVIDDKAASIEIKDKNNNSLTLDKGGVTIKSGKDISLEAKGNIKIKAAQNLKGEGLDVELSGQKGFKAAGQAMGEISSSGVLTVKGTLVKIN
ncbi:hypothetical protein C4J81_05685 [Deltaproteobacteria bacterium Smac51]|nr:hypothetical protein C4J81_05685 [Deltaproteobacteria bacterium Smac51]